MKREQVFGNWEREDVLVSVLPRKNERGREGKREREQEQMRERERL